MRIVSLVPAATEIAFALGSGDGVVAVTHDCDYPEAARALPRVTRSTIPAGTSSRDIDVAVRAAAAEGDSTFHVDASALADARPDILLGQTLCRVCAVTVSQLPSVMDPSPEILPLDGDSIAGIFDDIERVGEAIGRAREAASFVASLRERIDRVRERVAGLPHPTVVALEWVDPLFSAGHWVPEQVAAAGGVELIGRANARSKEISLDDVVAAAPDYVLILPRGFGSQPASATAPRLPSSLNRPTRSSTPDTTSPSSAANPGRTSRATSAARQPRSSVHSPTRSPTRSTHSSSPKAFRPTDCAHISRPL